MKLLIDSHAIVWWMTDDPRLSSVARQMLGSSQHQRFLSLASLWKLSLKVAAGRLQGIGSTIDNLRQASAKQAIQILPITYEHIVRVESLPLHHADPFDRLLVAQALEEGLTIVTADRALSRYPAPVVW
jgi:PIN domain nuclease of toxin-antitoxin system